MAICHGPTAPKKIANMFMIIINKMIICDKVKYKIIYNNYLRQLFGIGFR
ncbi:hypothetical protein NU09_1436 [Flavobacterium beibuense]|uniref:Uncharacterized protein n=1 Tax=Flavobacterium beibuense TaxID=657326 RepID=A0A444WDL3_9FLAO|nr:hypothetical protein NU09_1436 [Flavobacterium beibuense]